jgi:curved DNA-binding protein CbpA
MPESNYYKILGLTPSASEKEVRKKYRKLVMIYHPDKNNSPGAEEKFIEITEAYEILTGKVQAPQKGGHSTATTPAKEKKNHEDRIRNAKRRYREQIFKEFMETEEYFNELTKGPKWVTIKIIGIVGFILSSMLFADYLLPRHYEPIKVTHYHVNAGVLGADKRELSLIQTNSGEKLWISRLTYHLYGKYPNGYKETSWFFHNPISIISKGKTSHRRYYTHFTFYSFGWLTGILFLTPTLLFIYRKKTVRFTVLYQFCYYGVGILLITFLITGDRWAHVLSFGFL